MLSRRAVLNAVTAMSAVGLSTLAAAAGDAAEQAKAGSPLPAGVQLPILAFVYECDVTLSDAEDFGVTAEGHRRIIPITGGSFKGPELRGQVLSGGADWNLARSDGTRSVEAAYYLRTDDSVILRIVNKGVGGGVRREDPETGERFFMFTTPTFEAPAGKYEWMNHTSFVATLGARRDAKNAVLIRVFRLV